MHPSLGTVEEVPDRNPVLRIRVETAHFKLQDFAIGELEGRHLGVRCLLIGVEGEISARAMNLYRVLVFIHPPARDVHLVRSLVPQVGAAVIPEPVPGVMEAVFVERTIRSRSQPQIVIHTGGNRAVGLSPDAVPRFEAQAFGHVDVADAPFVEKLHRGSNVRVAPVLHAGFHDTVVFARRLDRLASFPNVVRGRLLHVNVLARLARPYRRQRMPVVRRRDRDCVDFLVVEHAAKVHFSLRPL